MRRFFSFIIRPCLEQIDVKHIIEIGSDTGGNTEQILDYCLSKEDCFLTAIDPFPQFDFNRLKQNSHGKFKLLQSLSLEAIPQTIPCDIALIDGDHNWYTVYNELKEIEKNNSDKGKVFPICFFHDTGWPYARRDMYYNPDNIPLEYQQPYAKGGMFVNRRELFIDNGANKHLYNAIREGGPRNGVLTGIEDFMKDSNLDLKLYNFVGMNGLSILFENTETNNAIFDPNLIQSTINGIMLEYNNLRDFL